MEKNYDVVVIGAGAVGSSVAYYASRDGLSVALLDENAISSGASAHATGFLSNTYDYDPGNNINDLLFESSKLFDQDVPRINELSGIDCLSVVKPGLRLALTESEIETLKERANFTSVRQRYPFYFMSGEETRKLDNRLSHNILAAGYIPLETQIDSYKFTLALAVSAEKQGTDIYQRKAVGLIKNNDRVIGVTCQSGKIYGDNIVVCSGIGSNPLLQELGLGININPLKGQSIRMSYSGEPLGFHFGGVESWHLIHRGDDLISAGSTSEFNNYDEPPNHKATETILNWVMSVMPCLEDARIVETMYGFRPMSPDNLPIVGALPTLKGIYLAIGHGHKGIHLSLVTGEIIKSLLAKGYADYNIGFMSPGRFIDS